MNVFPMGKDKFDGLLVNLYFSLISSNGSHSIAFPISNDLCREKMRNKYNRNHVPVA